MDGYNLTQSSLDREPIDNNSCTSNATNDEDSFDAQVPRYLWLYVGMFIFIFGLCGNILAIIVLQRPFYKKTSIGFLLSALAASDTLTLITGLLNIWLQQLPVPDPRLNSIPGCKIQSFILYFCQPLGAWTVLMFTLDRTFSVLRPLLSNSYVTRLRVIIYWTIMTLILGAIYAPVLALFTIEMQGCTMACNFPQTYTKFMEVFYWMDFTLVSFIPSIGIIISNALIMCELCSMRKTQRQLTGTNRRDDTRVVVVLLMVVSLYFLFATLPYALYYAAYAVIVESVHEIFEVLVRLLYYSNSAANFFLYCMSGRQFRKELKLTLRCFFEKSPCKSDPNGAYVNPTEMTHLQNTG